MASPKIMQASGTIRRARFVKVSGTETVAEADANEKTIGVSEVFTSNLAPIPSNTDDPSQVISGEQVPIRSLAESCLLEAGSGGWTAGDELKSDADGKGVAAATTGTTIQNVGAIALETVSAGELGRVLIVNYRVRPALS